MYRSIAMAENLLLVLHLSLNSFPLSMDLMDPNTGHLPKPELVTDFFFKDGVVGVSVGSLLPPPHISGPPHSEGHIQFLSLPV